MDRSKLILSLGLGIVMLLLVGGCTGPEACSYGGTAKAWIDSNENGQWDDGEQPLPGVQFTVSGALDYAEGGISNEKGEGIVSAYNMGCGASFSICAEPGPSYRLTTQRCIGGRFPAMFQSASLPPDELFFGFVVEAGKRLVELITFSDTQTKVYYAGYEPLPTGWHTPGFDDSDWQYAVLYQNLRYLDPATVVPFAGTGAQWISYRSDPAQLPDCNDPSMNSDGTTDFATYVLRRSFKVPATAYNVEGWVAVAADNYGWLYLNGDPHILEPKDPVGRNFLAVHQSTGAISQPNLACQNVLAARVENGATHVGRGGHGPMGVLFLLRLNYELPNVVWQSPATNDAFELKDGVTLPLKFKLSMQDSALITDVKNVFMTIHEGPGIGAPVPGAMWHLGEGVDSLRFDPNEYCYIASLQTENLDGAIYTAVIHDGCTEEVLGAISFTVSTAEGTSNGNKEGQRPTSS